MALAFLILPLAPTLAATVNPLTNLKAATPAEIVNRGDLPALIGTIIRGVLGLIGVLLVVLVIYAGFLWGSAAGDDSRVKKAKDIMQAAVIGIIIIFTAYVITVFILKWFGVNI